MEVSQGGRSCVSPTHTFLTEKDIRFYHDMVKNGALQEVELWEAVHEHGDPTGFIGLNGTNNL